MGLNREELSEKIDGLIKLGKEGKTWDFKRQWHEDKGTWVKHILAMANNETSEDSYIIIGVAEQPSEHRAERFVPTNQIEKDYKLGKDRENNGFEQQSELTKWLRKLPFADKCPDLDLELGVWVSSLQCLVDVIIVRSTSDCPYYLSEDYPERKCDGSIGAKDIGCWVCKDDKIFSTEDIEGLQLKDKSKFIKKDDIKKIIVKTETESEVVRANDVYTRIKDMSAHTFSEGLAGFEELEKLYRKKFGLDLSIRDKFEVLLSDTESWEEHIKVRTAVVDGNEEEYSQSVLVNKYNPDFCIVDSETGLIKDGAYQPPLYVFEPYYDKTSTSYLQLFFRDFLIDEFIYEDVDRYQLFFVRPAVENNFLNDYLREYHLPLDYLCHYYYFIKNDTRYKLEAIMENVNGNGEEYERLREYVQEYVIYFESEEEKEEYDEYLKNNIKDIVKNTDNIDIPDNYNEARIEKCYQNYDRIRSNYEDDEEEDELLKSLGIRKDTCIDYEVVKSFGLVPQFFVKNFYQWNFTKLLEDKDNWESDICGYYRNFSISEYVVCRNKRFKQFKLIKHTEQVNKPCFYLVYLPTESEIIWDNLYEMQWFNSEEKSRFFRVYLKLLFPPLGEIEDRYECIVDIREDKDDFCFVRPKLDNSQNGLSYFYFFNNSPERKINAILSSAHLKAFKERHKAGRIIESDFSSLVDSIGKWDKIFEKYVLCFENEEEKQEFDVYLQENQKDILSFYEKNRQKFEKDCRKICPKKFSSDVGTMVERGARAEKIAEIFRDWKTKKSSQ